MRSLAELYERGAHREVWEELVAIGPAVADPAVRAEAEAVARLTVDRLAANVALLSIRLTALGYRFGARAGHNRRRRTIEDLGLRDSMADAGRDVSWVDAGDVEETVMGWAPPGPEVAGLVGEAEERLGTFPLSLRALLLGLDVVDLSGSFPGWDPSAYDFADVDLVAGPDADGEPWPAFGLHSDPLNLLGAGSILELTAHPAETGQLADEDGRVLVPIAANHLLAANQAGDYHHVALTGPEADPVVEGVYGRPGIRLVEYLRVACEWGGFPGFEFADRVPPEIDVLRRDLLPL